jgi:hypothetical protein
MTGFPEDFVQEKHMTGIISRMAKKKQPPLEKEFTDLDGGKWIQTSAEDLFSMAELNKVIDSIEKEKDPGEIVLARIDFRTVNKEFHEAIIDLQAKVKKRDALLKKLVNESQKIIKRKNDKMLEMIEYIKKLQFIVEYNNLDTSVLAQYDPRKVKPKMVEVPEEYVQEIAEFEDVNEVLLDDEGNEVTADKLN